MKAAARVCVCWLAGSFVWLSLYVTGGFSGRSTMGSDAAEGVSSRRH